MLCSRPGKGRQQGLRVGLGHGHGLLDLGAGDGECGHGCSGIRVWLGSACWGCAAGDDGSLEKE